MRLRPRRPDEPASRASPHVIVGIVDNRGLGPVPPSAAIRVYRRVRNSSASSRLSFDRLDSSAYAQGAGQALDVLLVIRDAFTPDDADRALARARTEGTRVVVDLDDDLFTDHAVERLVAQGHEPQRLAALRSVLGSADAVTASTSYLADLVTEHTGAPVTVLPNELDPLLWATDPPSAGESDCDPDEVRLLYMGSKTHGDDLALLDGLPAALQDRLDRPVVLEVVGVTAGALPIGTRRLVPDKPNYAGFVRWLRGHQDRWHAGVAPLADTPFNAAKSDLKLLEYAALGLRTVASPTGPYAGAPAVLAAPARDPDEWTGAVERAVREHVLSGPPTDAREWVLRHRSLTRESVAEWEELLRGRPAPRRAQ